jgi:hypothetical protein
LFINYFLAAAAAGEKLMMFEYMVEVSSFFKHQYYNLSASSFKRHLSNKGRKETRLIGL